MRGVQISEAFWCVTRTRPSFWTAEKKWEIRGRSTHPRGPILIIKSGTGDIRVDGPNVTIENVHKLD